MSNPVSEPSPLRDSSVKPRLTRQPHRELTEYAAMQRRFLASWEVRFLALDEGDVEDLAELIEFASEVETTIASVVHAAQQAGRWSWADIARATGHTRQAAQQRWGGS